MTLTSKAAKETADKEWSRSPEIGSQNECSPTKPLPSGWTAAALQNLSFPPIKYVVDSYIPEGITIFAGRPKIGKSWACIDIAVAVASGSEAFGSIMCEQGDVLYLALEDNPRRLQSRMQKMYGDKNWPERLEFETRFPRLNAGAANKISEWIQSKPNPRLVIVDTLGKIRDPNAKTDGAYAADYAAISDLQELAGQTGLGILLVHHVRKLEADDPIDTVSGTLGLTGAADTILVLNRKSDGATLYGRGRDIDEIETAVRFSKEDCRWSILGAAHEVRRSDERTRILDCLLSANEPLTPQEIGTLTGDPKAVATRQMLVRMAKDGEIQKIKRGNYAHNSYVAPSHNGHNVTTDDPIMSCDNVTDVTDFQ